MKSSSRLYALICAGIFFGSLIVSAASFFASGRFDRQLFFYESYDSGRLCTEARRCVRRGSIDSSIRAFVDDLILGPVTNRLRPLFSEGTRTEFCFLDGKSLYVGLSRDALHAVPGNSGLRRNVALLRKNIMKNFTNIDAIYVYIDGKIVFEEKNPSSGHS